MAVDQLKPSRIFSQHLQTLQIFAFKEGDDSQMPHKTFEMIRIVLDL